MSDNLQKCKQTNIVGADNHWHPWRKTKSNYKVGEKMANNNNQVKKSKEPLRKTDVEFAQTGLEKIALKAQKSQNK